MNITTTELVSWDAHSINDGINFRSNIPLSVSPQADSGVGFMERANAWPVHASKKMTGRTLPIWIEILQGSASDLMSWFNTSDETEHVLIAMDKITGKQFYINALVKSFPKWEFRQGTINLSVAEPLWKSITPTSVDWIITGSGQTKEVTVGGNCESLPVFTVLPTQSRSNGLSYRKFITILNPLTGASLINEGTDLTDGGWDTAALTTAKMLASGDDLTVSIDGKTANRWLADMDTDHTKVWSVFSLRPRMVMLNSGSIAGSGTVAKIYIKDTVAGNETLANLDQAGKVVIGNEIFIYDGKSLGERSLTVESRAARDTSMGAHSDGDAITFIEHDIWIYYGNPSAPAPTTDDTLKPAFDLSASTNLTRVYTTFGNKNGLSSGGWGGAIIASTGGESFLYYGTEGILTPDPPTDMGVWAKPWMLGGTWRGERCEATWTIWDALGITDVSAGGKRYRHVFEQAGSMTFQKNTGLLNAAWITQFAFASPASAATWEVWTHNSESLGSGYKGIRYYVAKTLTYYSDTDEAIEIGNVTYTRADAVDVTMGAEAANYELACTLTNQTTNEALLLYCPLKITTQSLIIDTKNRTTKFADGSNAIGARRLDFPRPEWLRLVPGLNTLLFTDVGSVALTINISFEERNL